MQEEWEDWGFSYEEVKGWIAIGLAPQEIKFATFLHNNDYEPKDIISQGNLNLKGLREKYNKSQGWLDKNYPLENRKKTKKKQNKQNGNG